MKQRKQIQFVNRCVFASFSDLLTPLLYGFEDDQDILLSEIGDQTDANVRMLVPQLAEGL